MQITKAYHFLVPFCYLSAFAVLSFSSALNQDSEINSNSDSDFVTAVTPQMETHGRQTVASSLNSRTDGPRSSELAKENEDSEGTTEQRPAFGGAKDENSIQNTASTVNKRVNSECQPGSTVITLPCILSSSELDEWEAPKEIQKNYPYYLAGYDYDGRPLWVSEFGKYDIRKIVEGDQKHIATMEKYIKQGAYRLLKSFNGTEEGAKEIFYLVDFEGLEFFQFANPKSIAFFIRLLTAYSDVIVEHFAGAILINTNYIAEQVVTVGRSIIGRALSKMEVYGTQSSKWKPVLRRHFPLDTIPTWYGGSKDFKPIKIYG